MGVWIVVIICSSCSQSSERRYLNAGNKKNASGDYAGAIADFDRAIKIDPNLVKAYNNRGRRLS
jgi:tetratricopeptide (TPR) repeat protein